MIASAAETYRKDTETIRKTVGTEEGESGIECGELYVTQSRPKSVRVCGAPALRANPLTPGTADSFQDPVEDLAQVLGGVVSGS